MCGNCHGQGKDDQGAQVREVQLEPEYPLNDDGLQYYRNTLCRKACICRPEGVHFGNKDNVNEKVQHNCRSCNDIKLFQAAVCRKQGAKDIYPGNSNKTEHEDAEYPGGLNILARV